MKFCSECASPVVLTLPEDDNRLRHVCQNCNTIHYQNPRLITGTLPVYQGRIMLCRRGIEPRLGLWTLPAGFMENGETLEQGALRETFEETRSEPTIKQLLSIVSLPHFNQVHCFYLAEMTTPDYQLTPESTEISLFSRHEIPWDELAFRTVKATLEHYLEHASHDVLPILDSTILPE